MALFVFCLVLCLFVRFVNLNKFGRTKDLRKKIALLESEVVFKHGHLFCTGIASAVPHCRQSLLCHTTDIVCDVTQQTMPAVLQNKTLSDVSHSRHSLLCHTAEHACCVNQQPPCAEPHDRHCLLCQTAENLCHMRSCLSCHTAKVAAE